MLVVVEMTVMEGGGGGVEGEGVGLPLLRLLRRRRRNFHAKASVLTEKRRRRRQAREEEAYRRRRMLAAWSCLRRSGSLVRRVDGWMQGEESPPVGGDAADRQGPAGIGRACASCGGRVVVGACVGWVEGRMRNTPALCLLRQ